LLAKAKGKYIGPPSGVNQENYNKVKKALEKDLSVSEIVKLTGINISNVKRYKKEIQPA
jgi:DNA invertase Pin-like site-specific DNA recombinase